MRHLAFSLGLFMAICLLGCSAGERDGLKMYFDLSGLLEEEIDYLDEYGKTLSKTVSLNSENETLEVDITVWDTLVWERELKAFLDADINKPALLGKYDSDTLMENGAITKISYVAMKPSFRTRKMDVYFASSGSPDRVEISLATRNILYESEQQLIYRFREGYAIKGDQSIRFLEKDEFEVIAEFGFL